MSFDDAVLGVLSFVTLLSVLEWTGIMPAPISRWLHRNRLRETISILKECGIDIERHKKLNLSVSVGRVIQTNNLDKSLKKQLKKHVHKGHFSVGKTNSVVGKEFLDLMGATTDPSTARLFSQYLTSFWKRELESNGDVETPDIDFVVTPKGGSPILGYEFASRLGIPFILHGSQAEKFICEDEEKSFYGFFDCAFKPKKGSVGLIVDDSATGGRKVIEAYDDLKRYGYIVTDCLVLFEPVVKNVRKRLSDEGIKLHAITKR